VSAVIVITIEEIPSIVIN